MNVSERGLVQRNPLLDATSRDAIAADLRNSSNDSATSRVVHGATCTRILFVINSLEGGGAERVFSMLVNCIQQHLNATTDLEVLLLDDTPARFEISAGISTTSLDSGGSLWESAWGFKRFVAKYRPHLVISFLPRANYLAVAFSSLYGYRCIISERTDTRGRLGRGIAGWVEARLVRSLYPRAHRIVCVAEGVRRSLVGDFNVASDTACVIHNPIDLPQLNYLAQQAFALKHDPRLHKGFVLAVGRLTSVKRFDLLIRAYALGDFEQPLVILGEGPQLSELKDLASKLHVSSRVLFPGFLQNPYAVMARASVFVLSSDREGFPNGLVEAMALGLPVIATNCHHGPAEILDEMVMPDIDRVHQGKYGLLIHTNNTGALTTALRQVLTNDSLRQSLAQRACQRANDFAASIAMKRYAGVIDEQLALFRQAQTQV
jgi:N-acetylgalactosamine-N,N'-diacetylbacillosaminyl-diphospho-undecaprenol 4-alpha-N-acetylgalactosaminyltransferase